MRLADVFVAVRADMSDVNQAFRSLETGMGGVAQNLGRAGRSLTQNVTLPLVAVGGAAAKMAVDFDNTMGQLVGLANVPKESIEALREEIGALGAETGKGPQELAEAFYFVASAGFEAEEAMDVLRIAAKASAAGMGDVQDIARVLGGAINSYGKENLTAARAADILTAAVTEGTAEASEFASVLPQVVPAAAQLGVSLEEVTGAIAAITTTGSSAAMAAVGLNQVFSNLLKPTTEANDTLESFGLSAQGLRDQLENEGLISVLRTLETTFGDDEEAMGRVFGNTRSLRAAFSLLNLDAAALDAVMLSVVDSNDKLQMAFDATDNDGRSLAKSWSELQFAAIELGRDVLPAVVDVMKQLTGAVKGVAGWWRSLSPEVKGTIVQFLLFAAAAGPVLMILGKLVGAAMGVVRGVKFLVVGARLLRGAWLNIPTLMGFVDLAMGKVVTGLAGLRTATLAAKLAVAGLTAGLGALILFGPDIHRWLSPATASLQEFASQAGKTVEDYNKDLHRMASESGKSVGEVREQLVELMEAGQSWDEAWASLWAQQGGPTSGIGIALSETESRLAGLTGSTGVFMGELTAVVEEGAGEVFDPLSEEAIAAREAVVKTMADMLKSMGDMFQSTDDVVAYWQEFLDRLENPYLDTTRVIDLESRLAADAFQTALASNDSGLIADAVTRAETLIGQYELIEPGALAAGELVNPALQAGMDANLAGLITWIEANVTHEALTALTLEEAKELGIAGIWAYAQGIRESEQAAIHAAQSVSGQVKAALAFDPSAGGFDIVKKWIGGMEGGWEDQGFRVSNLVGHAAQIMGRSLPTKGPLQHPDRGGRSIGEAWIKALADSIGSGLATVGLRVGMVGAALGLQPGLASMAVPVGSGFASTGTGGGGPSITVISQSLIPGGPAERRAIIEAITPLVDEGLTRNGRLERRPRN